MYQNFRTLDGSIFRRGLSYSEYFLTKMIGQKGLPGVMSTTPWGAKSMTPGTKGSTGWLGKLLLKPDATSWSMANVSPWKSILMAMGIGGLSANDDQDSNPLMEIWLADIAAADAHWIPRFEDAFADGGRIGYSGGADYYTNLYSKYAQEIIQTGGTPMSIEDFIAIIKEQERTGGAQGGRIGYSGGANYNPG